MFEAIRILVLINLILLVIFIAIFVYWIDIYRKATEETINKKLKQLSDKTDENLLKVEGIVNNYNEKMNKHLSKQIKSVTGNIDSSLKENRVTFNKFIGDVQNSFRNQEAGFKATLKQIELNYKTYMAKVIETNEKLNKEIEKFNENNEVIKKLLPQLEKNNKMLEQVNDKTKEIIASYEISLSEELTAYNKTFDELKTKYNDSIKEMISSTESSIESTVYSIKKDFEKIHDQVNEKLVQLTTKSMEDIHSFTANIKKAINNDLKKLDTESIKELMTMVNKNLDKTVKHNENAMVQVKMLLEKRLNEIDDKLENALKKKRFF